MPFASKRLSRHTDVAAALGRARRDGEIRLPWSALLQEQALPGFDIEILPDDFDYY